MDLFRPCGLFPVLHFFFSRDLIASEEDGEQDENAAEQESENEFRVGDSFENFFLDDISEHNPPPSGSPDSRILFNSFHIIRQNTKPISFTPRYIPLFSVLAHRWGWPG